MKILSNTENKGRVVEFTQEEFFELFILAQTEDPNIEDEVMASWAFQMNPRKFDEAINGFDFSGVFGKVRAYAASKFHVNGIKKLIENYETFLEGRR